MSLLRAIGRCVDLERFLQNPRGLQATTQITRAKCSSGQLDHMMQYRGLLSVEDTYVMCLIFVLAIVDSMLLLPIFSVIRRRCKNPPVTAFRTMIRSHYPN